MLATVTTSGRKTRKGRAAGTVRPSLKLQNISNTAATTPPIQLQCLARFGVHGSRANMIASLVWAGGCDEA